MASNYQLFHMRSGRDSNTDLRGGRRVCYHCQPIKGANLLQCISINKFEYSDATSSETIVFTVLLYFIICTCKCSACVKNSRNPSSFGFSSSKFSQQSHMDDAQTSPNANQEEMCECRTKYYNPAIASIWYLSVYSLCQMR